MKTQLYTIGKSDVTKALVMAVLTGGFLPILAMFQTQGFSIFTADWHQIGILAVNGAILGFTSYIVKNYFSSEDGKFMGRIG